ncbi:MAG TPA: PAS domain-containing protein [Stellaceae bacterium]|jgi:hypothetical protein|nr:PAS domain-containing protein [Stellaceae bacterium]
MIPETLLPPEDVCREGGPFPVEHETDFDTETMRGIWRLFQAKRQGRALLGRQDIDPAEFVALLPRVALFDVHYDPLRFRMRLAGTNWRRDLGFEPTGMWLDDWPHEGQRRLLIGSLAQVVTSARASLSRRRTVIDDITLHYEALILPLAADGRVVDMLLTLSETLP